MFEHAAPHSLGDASASPTGPAEKLLQSSPKESCADHTAAHLTDVAPLLAREDRYGVLIMDWR